jgi:uncharacterized membrane protein YhaH (DUF805 family)
MHEAAAACPACGKPNAMLPRVQAADAGWFSFQGRITRKTYWLHYVLPLTAVSIVFAIFDHMVGARGIIAFLVNLAAIVPNLAGVVKRLHDRDRSGWFYLIAIIPLIGVIWLIVELGCLRGTRGPNRFGDDPLQDDRYPMMPASARV